MSFNAPAAGFFDDLIEGVAKEIIGPQETRQEPSSALNGFPEARATEKKVVSFNCSEQIVSAEKFSLNGNQLGSLCALSDETFRATMQEYKIENLKVNKEINVGWFSHDAKDALKHLIGITDESVTSGKNKGLLLMDATLNVEDSTLQAVILFDALSEIAPSNSAFVARLVRKFHVADPVISINSGNKFRMALEQKYGIPYKVINAEKIANKMIAERDKKIADFKKTFKMNGEQAFVLQTSYINPINSQIAEYQKMGNQDVQLFWKNNSGEELTILRGANNWYTLSLDNKALFKTYVEQIKQKSVAFDKKQEESALIPKL